MRLDRTTRTWEALAQENALRAIADGPAGDSLDTFLATGEREVAVIFDALESLGVEVRRGAALDFGCGVGRLTMPLASRFERVLAIDASPTMIRKARDLTAARGLENIELRTGQSARLDVAAASQDFVLSLITLQHVPPRVQARYVAEFVRVLAPGGVAVFQVITDHADEPSDWLRRRYRQLVPQHRRNALRRALHPGRARPEMYCISGREVLGAASSGSAEVVAQVDDQAAPGWVSRRFVLRRNFS